MTANATENGAPILQLRGINKSFGPVHVLKQVNFAAYPGQVTALVGDNGAGKSTLIKCIGGIHPIDSGEFLFEGKPVTVHGPRDASALGIEIVYQDLALCDNLDVVQNMFLGREQTTSIVLDEATHGGAGGQDAQVAVGADPAVDPPAGGQPVRRPAPDGRHRQGGALEQQGRDPRRADGGPRAWPRPSRCSPWSGGWPTRAWPWC